jgi:hypothetical protein
MLRNMPLVIAIALVLGTGVVRARWASRYADTRDLKAAAERLAAVPPNAGDWIGTTRPFDVSMYKAAGIQGALMRTYRNQQTGQEMTLLIVLGRPGPIAVHTPDICYGGAGYRMLSDHIPVTVDGPSDSVLGQFWKLRMAKTEAAVPENLNVTYGWSADGRWQAPERDARFAFADALVLFKLYAVRTVPPAIVAKGEKVETETDPTADFLRAFLPELNRTLFPPAGAAAPAPAA